MTRTLTKIFQEAQGEEPRLTHHNVLPNEFVAWMLFYADEIEQRARLAWRDHDDDFTTLDEQVALPLSAVAILRRLALEAVVDHHAFPNPEQSDLPLPKVRGDVLKCLLNHSKSGQEEVLIFLGITERRTEIVNHGSRIMDILGLLRQYGYVLTPAMIDESNGLPAVVIVSSQVDGDGELRTALIHPLRRLLRETLAGRAKVEKVDPLENVIWVIWPHAVIFKDHPQQEVKSA